MDDTPDLAVGEVENGDIVILTGATSQEDIDCANDVIDAFNFTQGLGDRVLVLPEPAGKAPITPFGAMQAVVDAGWADNALIEKILSRLDRREAIFRDGAPIPELVMAQDRNRNTGYGYHDEDELLTVIRQKRKSWCVITGGAHPRGDRIQLGQHGTYREAQLAAKREASCYLPAVMSGRVALSGEDASMADRGNWSLVKDHPGCTGPVLII